jgi:hypothetical protein
VVRPVGDHAHADPVGRIGARESVDDVAVLALEMGDHLRAQSVEVVLLERLVDLAPPDPVLGTRLTDDELVLRRATGEAAGVDHERAPFRQLPLAARQRVRVQQRCRRLPEDPPVGVQPVTGERGLGRNRYGLPSFRTVLPGDGPG